MEPKTNLTIQVNYRGNDWIARLKDEPLTWECGSSPEIAIGKLIISCNKRYGVEVEISLK